VAAVAVAVAVRLAVRLAEEREEPAGLAARCSCS